MTFGEHLEVFRKMLFRILAVAMIIAIVIFCAKDRPFHYYWHRAEATFLPIK